MTVAEEIIEEFAMFDDWMQKYEYLIELGKSMPIIDDSKKTDENIIKGCQSKVWLDAKFHEGKISYFADSDAILTKGIIAVLIRVFNNLSPQEVLDTSIDFIDEIGLKEHLSPTRANGLVSMVKQIKLFALAYQSKLN